jgi:hypothetical protein
VQHYVVNRCLVGHEVGYCQRCQQDLFFQDQDQDLVLQDQDQDFEKISRQDQDLTLQDQDQLDLSSQDDTKIKTFTADTLMLKYKQYATIQNLRKKYRPISSSH